MTLEEKKEKYKEVLVQTKALVGEEARPVPAMANICALLKEAFGFFWVGFYTVEGEELVLGPFQGPVACMSIKKGRGVCGSCWDRKQTVIVPDVEDFPGHIACNPNSKSEIVVPLVYDDKVVAVLDIDSDRLNEFDETDADFLQEILKQPFVKEIDKLYSPL